MQQFWSTSKLPSVTIVTLYILAYYQVTIFFSCFYLKPPWFLWIFYSTCKLQNTSVNFTINHHFYSALQIFLLPKVHVLPASHFPLYFHCPFDSQQMLVVSHCTLTVHQNVFLILQFLPAILTFLLRKRLQLITCQKYIL